ncbi:hypothetical protein [Streptomyces aureus]|uniref:hypothetical protein n=1 Tax=Streptomyces aureus TaxID=193461 RepID=UPI00055D4C0B|nr:hypothetical protein [Streptomyces aureus]
MRHRSFLAALVLAALALVAGCSDDDAGSSSGASTGVDQCVDAILANPDGSTPDECAGLSPEEQDEAKDAVEINLELRQKGRDNARDLVG